MFSVTTQRESLTPHVLDILPPYAMCVQLQHLLFHVVIAINFLYFSKDRTTLLLS